MVFSLGTVNDLKASASKVLEAVIENKNLLGVQNTFDNLSQMWESPSIVLFRRNYGHAAASMRSPEYFENWKNIVHGMNSANVNSKLIRYGNNRQRLLENMYGFYT